MYKHVETELKGYGQGGGRQQGETVASGRRRWSGGAVILSVSGPTLIGRNGSDGDDGRQGFSALDVRSSGSGSGIGARPRGRPPFEPEFGRSRVPGLQSDGHHVDAVRHDETAVLSIRTQDVDDVTEQTRTLLVVRVERDVPFLALSCR